MKKGVFALLLVALLLIPILATTAQAVTDSGQTTSLPSFSFTGIDDWSKQCREALSASQAGAIQDISQTKLGFFEKRLCLWLAGAPSINDPNNRSLIGETLKYLVLLLVIFLVYSVLKQVDFPESGAVKIFLAIIVGFMATFMVTTEELITSMLSYSALGIAFTLFFPIFLLGALTLFVATKASPIGIFFQKIAWLIYSLYLFIKAGMLMLARYYYNSTASDFDIPGGANSMLFKVFKSFGLADAADKAVPSVATQDITILIILFVVAIAVFLIGVKGNKMVVAWLEKEQVESAVESRKRQMDLAKADEKLKAEDIMKK